MNSQNYHNWNQINSDGTSPVDTAAVASKTFMTQVFAWMSGALLITALTSFVFAYVPALGDLLVTPRGELTPFAWITIFAPLAFVLLISFGINKLPFPALIAAFLVYSAVNGISLSFIFRVFTASSISATFIVTAGMFGTMAIMGFITKADLSGFGRIMMMGLMGLVLAMVVNFFMRSEMMEYIISFAGVAIFTGLTAWDVQKLKMIGAQQTSSEGAARYAIGGALTLYLDFINLFMFLLRLLGNRK